MIFDAIKSIFKPLIRLADKAIPDKDKKIEFAYAVERMEIELQSKALEYDSALMKAQASIITAEAQGSTYIQKAWRPWTMVALMSIVVYNAVAVPIFGLPQSSMEGVPDQMWGLLKIGIGGYIGGRTIEKAVKTWKGA